MKKLLKFAVVLGVVYVGATFAASFYAQRQYDRLMAMVEQELSGYQVKFTEQRYERGIFNSKAHMVVVLPVSSLLKEEYRFDVSSDIRSGPWLGGFSFGLVKIDSVVAPPSGPLSAWIFKLWEGKEIATSRTVIGFLGKRNNQTLVLPFQYSDGNRTIDFRGGTGSVDYPVTQLSFPFYEVKKKDGSTTLIENVRVQVSGNTQSGNFTGTVGAERWVASGLANESDFEARDLFLDIRGAVTAGLQNIDVKGRMTQLYGGETVRYEVDSETRNVNYAALGQLQEMIKNPYSLLSGGKEVDALWLSVIKPRPTVNFNLTMTQGGKTAFMRGNFKFDAFGDRDFLMNPLLLLLERGNAYAEVKIPVSFVNSSAARPAHNTLNDLLQKGTLVQQGQDYVGQYSFESNTFRVNGKKVSLF